MTLPVSLLSMNPQRPRLRRHPVRCAVPMLFAVLGLWILCPDLSSAMDLELTGGPGGNVFRAECPQGFYLVGLAGRTGEWVDRIAPICAPWLRGSQSFGDPTIGPAFGASTGGQERQRTCWGAGSKTLAIQSWYVETLRSPNPPVQYIEIHCVSLIPSQTVGLFDFGSPTAASEQRLTKGPYPHGCPPGEAAAGFRVRAGLFVDALGLICGPMPAKIGAPVMKLPAPVIQAPPPATPMKPITKHMLVADDMFVITKPAAGDRVPQGQLIVTATPPKVGMTNVTELELRYLDAPPNQRESYPYLTVFSVDTLKLLQGYPVAQIVTGGYAGRWQVRARSSMKAVPGPWSVPVQFSLVKAQQPSPMLQTPRLNAPITQAPSPTTGVAPATVRPPTTSPQGGGASSLMVRPRGVDQLEKKETGKPSPSMEKKP